MTRRVLIKGILGGILRIFSGDTEGTARESLENTDCQKAGRGKMPAVGGLLQKSPKTACARKVHPHTPR